MKERDELQIRMETEIADAIQRFEKESHSRVVDIRIDRYEGSEFCIGSTLDVMQRKVKR